MPAVIIPFPTPSGRPAAAIVRTGRPRTVRFVPRARGRAACPPSAAHTDQRLIDGARLTAANYRRLAEKATDRRSRQSMLDHAAKWDARAERLAATRHGPQQPAGELFS